jgi:hypothetical protein
MTIYISPFPRVQKQLGVEVGVLKNTLEQNQSIHALVRAFGRGILVLLPPEASFRYVSTLTNADHS